LEAGDRRFRSRQLVPEGLLSQDRRHDLVVRPLFFQQNQMGFVLFEIAQRELTICETLSTQISSALWGARLQEDRRQAEETLIEERNLLRTLIDNVPDRIYAKDTESRFIICNKALMQRMGASSPDDIIGKTDFDLVPHELAARFRADEEMIIQSGQPMLNREEPIDSPDGRMRWNLATKVPLRDSQGKIIGIVGVGREITELKRAEEALAEERNLLRTLIDALPDSVYVKDAESRFMIANAEATRRLGATTPDEVVGKTDLELYPERLATGYSADEQEVFRSGRPLINREELVVDQTTGERIWNLATKVPLRDSQGKVVALVGIGRNITERKIAEEALGYRSALLQTAAEVARATSGTLDLDELVQQVVDLLHERFGLYYAGLFLVDQSGSEGEPGKWAILRAGTGEAGRRMVGQGHRLEIGGESMIGWCIANSQARIALDVGEEAVRFENPFLPETRSELALPLVSRGEAIGALTIQSTQEAAFSGEDIAVLQTMASQVANALENTRLFAQAQLRAEEMVVLNELGQALSTHLSVRDVLNEVHQGASRLLDATNFYVALYDPDTHQVTFPYETTEEEEDLVPTMSADQGLTGYVIRHRTSLLIEEDVPKWMAEMGIEVVGKPSLCWLGAPMVAGDQVLGMLGVQSFTVSRAYGEHDRDLLVALANQTANAIANARLFEQAQTALREMEAVQRRYLQRVWSEYARTREVRGYEQTDDALIPLNDTLLPEVQQALQEQHSVVMDNGDGTSVLVVPVTLRGQPLGALGFRVEGGPERWSSDHIVLAEDVGEQLALAAENLRLLDETQRRAARERVTSEVTSRIRQSLDMERVLRAATDEIYQALGLERVVVRLKVGQDGANREGSTTGGGELGASQEEVA
jgi:PAS domain S-box-containing protein